MSAILPEWWRREVERGEAKGRQLAYLGRIAGAFEILADEIAAVEMKRKAAHDRLDFLLDARGVPEDDDAD